jgi:hypothetical protein
MAMVLIWLLGVFVCSLAAYLSASDYHAVYRGVHKKINDRNSEGISESEEAGGGDALASRVQRPQFVMQEDTLELTAIHALGFVVMASSGLLILFFFKVRTWLEYRLF